jgi:hypothetical protein
MNRWLFALKMDARDELCTVMFSDVYQYAGLPYVHSPSPARWPGDMRLRYDPDRAVNAVRDMVAAGCGQCRPGKDFSW